MREINLDFSINKYENIFNKIPYKLENNFNQRLSEKELTIHDLSKMTDIKQQKLKDLSEGRLNSVTLKDLLIISFILGINPEEIIKIIIFSNDKQGNEYSKGFIDGLFYAIQIIKNLDKEINLDKLLSVYNKLST